MYFALEHRAACDRAGLRGGWMAYFASRAAPLGPVTAEVVAALFYNFHPAMVARALPDAWTYADPGTVLQARREGVDAALRRVLGRDIDSPQVRSAAELAVVATDGLVVAGRPMYAANLSLGWPDEPHLRLWHAATLLREHRGDGHVAALGAAQVDGCQAHVLQVAAGAVPRELLQPNRGWSDDDWDQATQALRDRGWVTDGPTLTDQGRHARDELQRQTDRLATEPIERLGAQRTQELLALLEPVLQHLQATADVPYPNPMGLPAPEVVDG